MEVASTKKHKNLLTLLKPKSRNRDTHSSLALVIAASAPTSDQYSQHFFTSQPPELCNPLSGNATSLFLPTPTDDQITTSLPPITLDAENTKSRYSAALKRLNDVIEVGRNDWDGFAVVRSGSITENISQLREGLETVLRSWNVPSTNTGIWSSSKQIIRRVFTATSPFLKHFFLVGGSAAQIPVLNPYGLVANGLLLLLTIADREVARKAAVQRNIDYICRQLELLNVVGEFPAADLQAEPVTNRATDVLSSAMNYLAVHIRHEPGSLGVLANIGKTILMGEEDCAIVNKELQDAISEFNSALDNFAHRIGFRTFELGRQTLDLSNRTLEATNKAVDLIDGVRQDLSIIHANQIERSDDGASSEDRFIVPYQRNPHFKGRSELLTKLYDKLREIKCDRWNHRVALYGLGGVGKTQLALEYLHSHWQKKTYERVYWISAVNQAIFFDGLQEVGIRTHCIRLSPTSAKPSDTAVMVVRWLNRKDNWLLVIDNLDDVEVVNGYLPDQAPNRHILITTRNQHCDDIPAEGLEVSVLDMTSAIDLLLTRAKLVPVGETPEARSEACQIVNELGFLPLAIEQASAYIREASHDLFQFLTSYREDRKFYHARTSRGNRMYSGSLATTWHISFQKLQKNCNKAAQLLRLLAFLNPDGIIIEFLKAGMEGLPTELHDLIADSKRFYDALAELARFSLIGRQDGVSPRITIHRLVQSIIKDEMCPEDFSSMMIAVLELCGHAYPDSEQWETFKWRQQGRKYQDQVVPALLSFGHIRSTELARLLQRVGIFLRKDGKYQEAQELLTNAVKVFSDLKGSDHPDSLTTMANLAITYRDQGKLDDAQKLEEKVLDSRERLLGPQHPGTLTAMANLASTYCNQGKLDDAQKLQEKVLDSRERLLGPQHPQTLTAMANLAVTYCNQGKLDDAQKLQEKVLDSPERLLGPRHPETLRAMANLAVTYWNQGKLDDAQKLEEKVLNLCESLLGPQHPETLRAIANLAVTYRALERISESIELLETAAGKCNQIQRREHPRILRMRYHLALSYQAGARLGDAIGLLEDTLATQKAVLGDQHPQTKDTVVALEKAYRQRQDEEDSHDIKTSQIASLSQPDC